MNKISLPDILKNTEFLKLWGNQILLQVGLNMCNYAALLIIANKTHSVFAQSQFYAALTIPAFAVGLIAGPLVDSVDRRRIMLIANLFLGFLFLAYIFTDGGIFLIMSIAFLTSIAARFFIPAEIATIPLIVDKKNLDQANAFFLFTLMGSVLLGYSVTGPIIQTFGGLGTAGELVPFLIGSVIVFVGFFLILKLKKIEFIKLNVLSKNFLGNAIDLFMQSLREVRRDNRISLPILLLVFVELIVGVLSVALLEYIRRYLNLPLTSASLILIAPLIIGLLVGGIMLRFVEKKYGRKLSIYLSCVGIGMLFLTLGAFAITSESLLGVILSRIVTTIAAFAFGIFIVFISVQSRTVLQTHTKIQMQGRIFSLLDIMIAVSTPIPVLLLGFFADSISIPATLIFMGILIVAGTVFGNAMLTKKAAKKTLLT